MGKKQLLEKCNFEKDEFLNKNKKGTYKFYFAELDWNTFSNMTVWKHSRLQTGGGF
jgi:hypothetical protein